MVSKKSVCRETELQETLSKRKLLVRIRTPSRLWRRPGQSHSIYQEPAGTPQCPRYRRRNLKKKKEDSGGPEAPGGGGPRRANTQGHRGSAPISFRRTS